MDPREWVRQRAAELTRKEKEENKTISVKLSPARRIQTEKKRTYHAGDLFLQPYFHRLGIGEICKEIGERGKYKFNLEDILAKLVYGRILFPDSKLSTWQHAKGFIEQPKFELEDLYRALSVLSRESDFIQSQLYRNSIAVKLRNTKVIYYDCSNYYFEIESDVDFRKYGHSKEHRPNPIVQLGLFMDADGLPLAFCVNPGNTPETQTMQPLEEKLADNFSLSDFVACTDGGLGSVDNRMYNTTEGRFDDFYAYGTSLDDHPLEILKVNSFRGEIEALFRVTKTNLNLRPIYLSRKYRIIGHFITCFISLLLLKQLQHSLPQKHSIDSLCDTLRSIKLLYHDAYGYEPAFDRTDLTDELQANANILIDTEIIPKPAMRKILKQIKER